MTCEEALSYIHSFFRKGAAPGLHRIRALLAAMGHPEETLQYVHITGTNGKGSTAAITASVLRKAGYKTGLFTSPFLWRFNERINIDGRDISDEALAALTEYIRPFADAMEEQPTEFELVTAMGIAYFSKMQCDVVVLEVGLGGLLDATNAIPAPAVAAITNIGLEHTQILGDTLEKIAAAKAGILKTGCEAVLYPSAPGVISVVEQVCRQKQIPLTTVDFGRILPQSFDLSGQCFSYGNLRNIRLPLLGSHQQKNCAVALEAIFALRRKGFSISDNAIYDGIANTVWPGRFELLRRDPVFLVDGGHNPQCLQTLAENTAQYLSDRDITALTGVMADKDCAEMYQVMIPHVNRFVTVTPDNPRAMDCGELAAFLSQFGKPAIAAGDVAQGVEKALELAGKDGVVLAFGSLFMTGPIRQLVKTDLP